MKKEKLLYILIFILLIIAGYYFFNNQTSTLGEQEGAKSDFAIENVESINKIFIADAKGQGMTLLKYDKGWKVNDKYDARPDNIRLLMKTFKRIAVRSPVPKAAFKNIVKHIATSSTKVEIYQGGKTPSKVYYIGRATMDKQGTYMLLETDGIKSTVPYIMHIPGFRGFLTSRFFSSADQWRDAAVFKYKPEEIKKVSVVYSETPKQSFVINKENNEWELLNFEENKVKDFDEELVKEYLLRYEKVYYEMVDEETSKHKRDSIISTEPYFRIKVEGTDGKTNAIAAFHIPNYKNIVDNNGEEYLYDIDRMHAYLNKELFLYIQFPTFDPLTVPISYFSVENGEKNKGG